MGPQNPYGVYGGSDFQYQMPQKQPFLKTRRGKLLVVGGVLILLVAILGAVAGISSSSNKNKSERLVASIFNKFDAKKSYELLGSHLQQQYTEETWSKKIDGYKDTYSPGYKLTKQGTLSPNDEAPNETTEYYIYKINAKKDANKIVTVLVEVTDDGKSTYINRIVVRET